MASGEALQKVTVDQAAPWPVPPPAPAAVVEKAKKPEAEVAPAPPPQVEDEVKPKLELNECLDEPEVKPSAADGEQAGAEEPGSGKTVVQNKQAQKVGGEPETVAGVGGDVSSGGGPGQDEDQHGVPGTLGGNDHHVILQVGDDVEVTEDQEQGALVVAQGSPGGNLQDPNSELKSKWLHLSKILGVLAAVLLVTAIGAIVAASLELLEAVSHKNRVYLMYFLGSAAPWLAGKIPKCVDSPWVKRALPYICFFANSIAAFLFSTGSLGHVSLRATIIMALIVTALVPYAVWQTRREAPDQLSFVHVLSPYLVHSMEAGKVSKASYVKVMVTAGFFINNAVSISCNEGGDEGRRCLVEAGHIYVDFSTDATAHIVSTGVSLFFVGS